MALELRDLTYRYRDAPAPALQDVTAALAPHRVVALAGPSGAGKSTLARLVAGLLPGLRGGERGGEVVLDGAPLPQIPTARVGMVMQDPEAQMAGVRVGEELAAARRDARAAGGSPPGLPADEVFAALRVERLRDRRIQGLSGGELQGLALAVTLARGPRCVVLDEPTSNLDAEGGAALRETLRRLLGVWDGTVLVADHRPEGPLELAGATLWLTPDGRAELRDGSPSAALREQRARCCPAGEEPPPPPGDVLLELDGVAGGFRRSASLRGVSLTVREGEIIGIRGPNGSGKSTLLALIAGALRRSAGQLRWRGRALRRAPPTGELGVLLQSPLHQLFCDTVRAEVVLSPRNHRLPDPDAAAAEMMDAADLSALAARPTLSLSYGQQQRVALAAALAHRPALALLDEPTHGMDAEHMGDLVRLVRRRRAGGTAYLIASHDQPFLDATCDRVLELRDGSLAGG